MPGFSVGDRMGTMKPKKTVYLETSFFSLYYDGRPDAESRRRSTREWWKRERRQFELFTSRFTLEEVKRPIYPNWKRVAELCGKVAFLEVTADIAGIVKVYVDNWLMPADDAGDAAHLAMASYHGVDYLVTWNCRHLANANKFDHIRMLNRRLGLLTPEIVTPDLLFTEG